MIYFVRHGSTEWNKIHKCQGRTDVELSQLGVEQALKTKEKIELSKISFDAYFCSPLKRAKQTFEIITKRAPLDNEIDERIIERDFGEFEGLTRSEFDFKGFWHADIKQQLKTAESLDAFILRITEFLEFLRKNHKNKNVLVVSHGGVGFILSAIFNGIPNSRIYCDCEIPNGSFQTFQLD